MDEVPGLGPAKRRALLKHFGSVRKLRSASVEELQAVQGVGPALAAVIRHQLAPGRGEGVDRTPVAAVNMATGEILDS